MHLADQVFAPFLPPTPVTGQDLIASLLHLSLMPHVYQSFCLLACVTVADLHAAALAESLFCLLSLCCIHRYPGSAGQHKSSIQKPSISIGLMSMLHNLQVQNAATQQHGPAQPCHPEENSQSIQVSQPTCQGTSCTAVT